LASLVDPSQSNPALPIGHPFSNVQLSEYWSANTVALNTTMAWRVFLTSGGALGYDVKTNSNYCWCVRGRQGVDIQ
jgi:hypothetical protein